ncbi:hypothetical protein B0H34DRAFT_476012 [Crassisporium funariophilum]|nr:hypothetical protein B0H34DRAFT_476012 [Crassisporium funariophilum]
MKQKTSKMKVSVQLDASGTKATSLTIRHDVTRAEARKSLSNKAAVTTAPVSDQALLVSFGNYKQFFMNPLPIRGSQCKTRIARQSFYVEVIINIRWHG